MPSQGTQDKWTRRAADHLFHRAGFGGTPEERKAFYELGKSQGIEAAVDQLLETTETWASVPRPYWSTEEDPNGDIFGDTNRRRYDLVRWYYEALLKGQPVAAKLMKFFVDHFPVDQNTFPSESRHIFIFRFFELLRQHAAGDVEGDGKFGNFRTLANDVSWSEAMIRMLDLYRSSAGNINENFGRELLELFTIGVDGGYTEDDVGAAAEAFTGRRIYEMQSPHPNARQRPEWELAPPGEVPASSFQDVGSQDFLPKSFMGFERMPNGQTITTGDDIMELIFANIQTAKHLCWKLWRYFASPNPSDALLNDLALRFRDTHDYDIRALLKDIFMSEDFYDESVVGDQVKDAGDYVVMLLKQFGFEAPPSYPLFYLSDQLGYMPLFPPNIAGWPEPDRLGNGWMAAGSLVLRLNVPTIWTHLFFDTIVDRGAQIEMYNLAERVDWDTVLPENLRAEENFPHLIEHISQVFLPQFPLRDSQIRTLYSHYKRTSERMGRLIAAREVLRLVLSLPEYQMQ